MNLISYIGKQGIFNKAADFLSRHPTGFDESAQIKYDIESDLTMVNVKSTEYNIYTILFLMMILCITMTRELCLIPAFNKSIKTCLVV